MYSIGNQFHTWIHLFPLKQKINHISFGKPKFHFLLKFNCLKFSILCNWKSSEALFLYPLLTFITLFLCIDLSKSYSEFLSTYYLLNFSDIIHIQTDLPWRRWELFYSIYYERNRQNTSTLQFKYFFFSLIYQVNIYCLLKTL